MSAEIDLAYVADVLRTRRRVLQPEDVGLPRGRRRRTPGLRRDEVAALCSMSIAYYSRLECRRVERRGGPRPSPSMLAGLARGLRFTRVDRDRLFAAAGYDEADSTLGFAHVDPGLMRVLDRIADVPAMAIDPTGQVIHQTRTAATLFGDPSCFTGWARSSYYRWFIQPAVRQCFTTGEQSTISSEIVVDLRRSLERNRPDHGVGDLTRTLLNRSAEFAGIWSDPASSGCVTATRKSGVVHPDLGVLELQRETLFDKESGQRLVMFLAAPCSEGDVTLNLASVIGHQRFPV